MQISCWWCISLVRTGFVDLRRRENRDRSHGTIMSRRLRPTDISSRRSCARYRAYRVFSFVFRGERAGRRRGRDVSTESFEKVFRDAKYIYMWFEDSSNYELREEFVYRLNEILILLGWFRSTIDESWKRFGFIDPRSPCKHAPCIRDIERVIFTAIPLSSRSRKRPCECVDYRFYWCVEKWPARFDSRRYFFLSFFFVVWKFSVREFKDRRIWILIYSWIFIFMWINPNMTVLKLFSKLCNIYSIEITRFFMIFSARL